MDIAIKAATGSIKSVAGIAAIVIPLMIVMQIMKDYNVLDGVSKFLKPMTDFLGLSEQASFPLIIGLVFGLSYGSGVIVQSSKEGSLTKKDIALMIIFLINCHAVFEDTLIFVAVGANGFVLLFSRIAAAFALTYFMSKRMQGIDDLDKFEQVLSKNKCCD